MLTVWMVVQLVFFGVIWWSYFHQVTTDYGIPPATKLVAVAGLFLMTCPAVFHLATGHYQWNTLVTMLVGASVCIPLSTTVTSTISFAMIAINFCILYR